MGPRERLKKAARNHFGYCKEIVVPKSNPVPGHKPSPSVAASTPTSITTSEPPQISVFAGMDFHLNRKHNFNGFFEPESGLSTSDSDGGDNSLPSTSYSSSARGGRIFRA